MKRFKSAIWTTAAVAAVLSIYAAASGAAAPADDEQTIVHVLNRIAYGPRPGDIERIRQMGVRQYIEQQLHPEHIADENLEARLRAFPTLTMSAKDIAERYEIPAMEARR